MYTTREFTAPWDLGDAAHCPPVTQAPHERQGAWAGGYPQALDIPQPPGPDTAHALPRCAAPWPAPPGASRTPHGFQSHTCPQVARRRRRRPQAAGTLLILGPLFAALTALTATALSVLFWISCATTFRDLAASHVPQELAQFWPAVIYGPWVVACLSGLPDVFERRRVEPSRAAVVVFCGAAAAAACAADALATPSDVIVAGLSPIAAAISGHQFVSQVAVLGRPSRRRRHAVGRQAPPQPKARSRRV